MSAADTRHHFKFLDHYDREDREIFFGRNREIEALYEMVKMSKMALVYGLSGTGKTSLVRCGLASKFSENNWFPVFVRRGADLNASLFGNIRERAIEPIDNKADLPTAIESLYLDYYVPVYLIFDQFEELFILGDHAEQAQFFQHIADLYKSKVSCRILIIVREEYLGYFSYFEKTLPTLFENRFRVEKMNQSQLEEVVHKTITAPRFGIELRMPEVTVPAILDNIRDEKREIDLTNLQMYLDRLWRTEEARNPGAQTPVFDLDLVNQVGELPEVLSLFLDEQLAEIGKPFGDSQKNTPLEVLTTFVTNEGTKLGLTADELEDNLQKIKGIPVEAIAKCVQAFTECKILRGIKQGDAVRYEIAHDLLAKQVFARFSMEETARRKADGVYKIYREIGQQRTLTKEELETLSEYLRVLPPDEDLKTVIATARLQVRREEEAERVKLEEEVKRQKELIDQKEKGQRLRMWMTVGSAVFALAMLILVGFTYRYYLEAQEAKKELALKGYEAQLTNCLTLKKDGKYDEAIEQLTLAEDFAKVLSPEKEETVRQLQQSYVEEKATVKQAEDHLAKGELRPALELYQKAAQISDYDTRLKGKVFEIERTIETEFEKSKQAGDAMLKAGEYRRATQNYEKALKLKPGEKSVQEKLLKSKALEQ